MELSDKSAAPQIASYDHLSMVKEQDELQEKVADQIYAQIRTYKALIKEHVKKKVAKHIASQSVTVDSEQQQLEDLKILRMVAEAQFVLDELERE